MSKVRREYGHIPGVPVGTHFRSRKELFQAGVHGQMRAGIHGNSHPNGGAFSICLSGRYEDDEDWGDKITYVGSGGQADNGSQLIGQSFSGYGNKSLHVSFRTKNPVRVIRGADKKNDYAPSSGYRYDGLYVVDSAEMKPGKAGHNMCFFELSRVTEEDRSTGPPRGGDNEDVQ